MPVIMVMIFGTLEACEIILLKQSITVAAYEGARTALVPDTEAISAEAVCLQVLSDRNVTNATITITPFDLSNVEPGEYISVDIIAPTAGNCALGVFSGNTQVAARVEMMYEF